MKQNLFLIILIVTIGPGLSYSQVNQNKDTTNIYQKIEDVSKKGKFTKFLHKLVFKPTDKKPKRTKKKMNLPNLYIHEGKIIRNIIIDVKDPFGFSFSDPTEVPNSFVEKTGNQIHIRSKPFTIKNLLLFKKNTAVDTLLINESARLLRAQNYIRSVRIEPTNTKISNDSIDILITVLDSWSILPRVNLSANTNRIRLLERNFLGLGHEFRNGITKRLSDGETVYDGRYRIPNFKNSFVSLTLNHRTLLNGNRNEFASVERPFYSPLAKWAGGIYLDQQFRRDSLINAEEIRKEQSFKYRSFDTWVGYAFNLFNGSSTKERTTNLITSARFLNVNYFQKPELEYDTIRFFSNQNFIMGSIGLASRQFERDNYIFNDGRIEDVPIGSVYALTFGNQRKNKRDRLYLGARVAHGRYFKWGFLSTNFEYGTFVKNKKTEQTAYGFRLNYFTPLIHLGEKWTMRQFIKPQFLIGTNRLPSEADRLTINDNTNFDGYYGDDFREENDARIIGFNSDLLGTTKYVLSVQTQFYSPWEVLGFRLNPFVNYTGAIISNEGTRIKDQKLYSAFTLGFIVRNDYLVFNSFQLSFSFFPIVPGEGRNIFDPSSFETDAFGFEDFNLGKPQRIRYN